MGLASGFLWGVSMVALRRVAPHVSEFDKLFVQFVFLGALFALFTLVPGGRPWVLPTAEALLASTGWLLLLGLFWMPVVMWLTMFGGSRLDPGRVAVLLTLEVVVGLTSAALLTHEPFGARELIGAVFITAACGSEFFAHRPGADQDTGEPPLGAPF